MSNLPTDLFTAAQELLDAATLVLDDIPDADPSLLGAPERAFVAHGAPVLDCCDQLSVWVPQINSAPLAPGGLGAGRQIAARINHVFLTVTISRCYPVPDDRGEPPPVADIVAASQQLDADAWALWNGLPCLWTSGDLFTVCDEVFWDSLRPIGPQGGCAGWDMGIHISLDGYTCDVPAS